MRWFGGARGRPRVAQPRRPGPLPQTNLGLALRRCQGGGPLLPLRRPGAQEFLCFLCHGQPNSRQQRSECRAKWRFKCDPSNPEKADAALEVNFTNKVRQMLHEEKAAAIKRLNKNGDMPTELDEEGNSWPTKEALISAKPPGFGTVVGWRLLCEHWSSAASRKISLTNKKNRLAHGETVFHTSGARSAVSTRQHLKLKTGEDPGISGVWLHTHNLHRGTDQEKICSQRASERWENFDKAMTNAHGENWEEEHPELDAQIIYDAVGRMPHGRLGIGNELFTKTEKSKIKSRRPFVSEPVRSAREDRLERENDRLKRDNKRLRGIELVVRSLADKGGVDYDAIMQSADQSMSDS